MSSIAIRDESSADRERPPRERSEESRAAIEVNLVGGLDTNATPRSARLSGRPARDAPRRRCATEHSRLEYAHVAKKAPTASWYETE